MPTSPPKTPRVRICSKLLSPASVALAFAIGLLFYFHGDRIKENQALIDQISRVEKALDQVRKQMVLLLGRLEEVVPVRMPPDWGERLGQIEARLKDETRWPENPEEAGEFIGDVRRHFVDKKFDAVQQKAVDLQIARHYGVAP